MSLTINSATFGTWKRMKAQYVVAIAGAALALSAAIGVGAWQVSDSGGGAKTVPAASVQPVAPATHTYYIVDSPEEARLVAAFGMAASQAGQPVGRFEIIDASGVNDASFSELMSYTLQAAQAGVSVQVFDLRGN